MSFDTLALSFHALLWTVTMIDYLSLVRRDWTMRSTFPQILAFALFLASLSVLGCSSSGETQSDEERAVAGGMTTDKTEDGLIVERLDTEGDGNADIIRYFEEYRDPRDETRTRRRLRRMEIDVTADGKINVRRHYDDHGNVELEENDLNLDGRMDSTLYFVGGELARKELMDPDGEYVRERRIYYDGQIVRVDTDFNGNGETDRWEYYENGVLMRIGSDTVGDGAADTWQLR